MKDLLAGKVVLVSGGTQGLGAGIARAAAREGATVVVTGRNAERGEQVAAELREGGADASFVRADVSDVAQARGAVAATVERHGRIDGLVNAAGLTTRGTLLDTTPELFDQHVAVNLRGPFFLMQAAVADMVRRGEPGAHRQRASRSTRTAASPTSRPTSLPRRGSPGSPATPRTPTAGTGSGSTA